MRFCTVLGWYPKDTPGGAEFQAYLIARELAQRGHEAHYVAYRSSPTGTVEDEGLRVHRLNEQYSPPNVSSTIVETVQEIDPDYAYFRNFRDLYILNELENDFTGETIFNISHDRQCFRLANNWRQLLTLSNIYKWITNPSTYLTRRLLPIPDYRFAQTRYQQSLLNENFNLDSSYVGNGHPVPEDIGPKHNPPIVLWLAGLKSWKRPHIFLSIAEACQDLDCQFWVVGRSINEEFAEEVIDRINSMPNAEYKGGCSIEESNSYIRRASLFVNTSKQEGFPNTFIQSWLRGTPVVSLDVDPDGILRKQNVGVFADGDIDTMIESIRELVANQNKWDEMSTSAYEYGRSNHDISVVADRILSAIGETGK